jgi:hypothetical protein
MTLGPRSVMSARRSMRRLTVRTIAILSVTLVSMAHVGSPDTFFTGQAGPYPVRVSVRLPGVIPGRAQVSVRVAGASADSIERVTFQAVQWNLGLAGAPPPDVGARVPGDPELFAAELWFMSATSYRVLVVVQGRSGEGTAVVPVMAIATAQRPMPRSLGLLLSALGLFLVVGLLTIIGAAVRESVVPPGELPDPKRRRRARIVVACWAVVLTLAVAGGRAWWNAEALAYGQSVLFRPFASSASVADFNGHRTLTLLIDDRRWPPQGNVLTRYNALMPDHGKLMHMFLIREPGLDAFAHVHPVARPSATAFDVELPSLPAGRYRVYGDIVHESGYTQTLIATAALGDPPAAPGPSTADSDDSWFAGAVVAESETATIKAADGTTIVWQRGEPMVAGQERLLTFTARDPGGAPAALTPYMGMLGHVAIARSEGDVFAHLHPFGSVSMAALQKFTEADRPHAHQAGASGDGIAVPYAFPKAGRYRMWVQMKRDGQILTGAFDVNVREAR